MKKSRLLGAVCAAAFGCVALSPHADPINLRTVPMTVGSSSLSFDANGTGVSVEGYHVEYDSTDGSTNIYGPFSTAPAFVGNGKSYPNFGRITSISDGSAVTGLSMYTIQSLGQTDHDDPTGGFQPGFDNTPGSAGALPSIQLALFSFSEPVDVSQIIIDDVANNGRSIWVAGGNTAPDFGQDLLTALSDYTIINSSDDASDGLFTHNISPLMGIRYLVIGTPPRSDLIGDLGPLVSTAGDHFYIDELDITSVPIPVPTPAEVWLFGFGLLGLLGIAKLKKVI